jgi:type I restriction enzyme M protein
MRATLSNEDARRWPAGKGHEFDKLVVFSAWLLLASYDEDDDTLEDAAITAFEEGDDSIWEEARERVKLTTWRRWRHLGRLEDAEFQAALADEIIPALERDFLDRSHPLTLVRLALDEKPIGVIRREWQRAIEFWDMGGDFNRDDARAEWEVQSAECSLSQHPGVLPYKLQNFLADALVPQWGECFLDLSARDGGVANRAADLGARRFNLYERDEDLALLAATRIRLHRACDVCVFLDDPPAGDEPEPIHDCVAAAPPFGLKVDMSAASSAPVPTQRGELIQLQRAVAALKPGGRAAVLMPNRFLFADGDDRRVREWLLREHCVEAVVDLPGRTLSPVSEMRGAVILIRRQAPREEVWFVPADQFLNASESPSVDSKPGGVDYEILYAAIAARWNLGKPDELRAEIAKLEAAAASEKYEFVEADGMASLTENNRQLLALARHFLGGESPEDRFPELVRVEEILRRKGELLWKKNRGESLGALLSELAATREDVRLARLDEVTEVLGGATYTSRDFLEPVIVRRNARGDAIGLVRVSDFPRFAAGEPAVRVLRNVKRHIEKLPPKNEQRVLRPNDVLVSIGGTIGRVCLFEVELGHPSLAGNGLAIVRTKDRLTSAFLAKLFTSDPYQQWFAGESTGNIIRHLTLRRLRELPVPVLPRTSMLSIADELETGASEIRIRAVFNSKREFSALAMRLAESRSVSLFAGLSPDELERATATDALKVACDELIGWERLAIREGDALGKQLNVLQRLATGLLDILILSETGDRFALLQEWRISAGEFEREFRRMRNEAVHATSGSEKRPAGEMILFQRTEGFIANLLRLAQAAMKRQLRDVRIKASVTPAMVTVGKLTEVQFSVTNVGSLLLRKFGATTSSLSSVTTKELLPAYGTHVWTLVFTPQKVGRHTVDVSWKAHRLDDEPVSGSVELALEVQSLRSAALDADLGENPYVYARVLDGEDDRMFYGRARVLDELAATLSRRGATTIKLIEGNRRIGKTSLLRHFVRHRMPGGWLAVFINFQDFEGDTGQPARAGIPTRAIFTGMARELIRAVATAVHGLEIPELGIAPPATQVAFARYLNRAGTLIAAEEPFASFRTLIETLRAAIYPRRLLLMFDEFDRVQEGIESGVTSDQVPENIRHLFQTYNDLAGFFTGSRTIRRLRMEYWNVLFGMGEPLKLTGLEEGEARQLIEQPVAGRLVFTDEAVRLITTLTARQPLLIQAICLRLFDLCKAEGERSVGASLVERVAQEKAADNEHFETLWSHIASDRQRLLVFLVDSMEGRKEDVSFDRLRDATEEAGVAFTQRSLKDALTDLLDLEVLRVIPQPTHARYEVAVPLFARWLRHNKDCAETRSAAKEED